MSQLSFSAAEALFGDLLHICSLQLWVLLDVFNCRIVLFRTEFRALLSTPFALIMSFSHIIVEITHPFLHKHLGLLTRLLEPVAVAVHHV